LQKKFDKNFTIEFLFSRSRDVLRSRITPESLEVFMLKHNISFSANTLYYVCGPGDYMRMITIRLISLGVNPGQIKKEIFHVQHPTIRPEPPDTNAHTVTLMRNNNNYRFTVQYPVTILQAAKLLNIPIPYSCESGQCGTCVARCLEGKVWMAQNEVLLEEEMQAGAVLTCTGFPIYGDVTLKI
jgi:ring-1,2-phenylacetyl-CoA epoxidase subunit PaaE